MTVKPVPNLMGVEYMYGDIGLDACAIVKIRNKVPFGLVGTESYSFALIKANDVQIVPNLFEVGM